MAISMSMTLSGDRELAKMFATATDRELVKALRAGLVRGGAVVRKAMRQRAPVETGTLRRSLGQKAGRGRARQYVVIGPRRQFFERGRRPVKYAHLVEGGTRPHRYKTRKGQHPGARAKPFMRPAFEASRHQALLILRQAAASALSKMKAKP